jgi:uncharacterized phosphosugar-binding protein
MSAAVDYHDRVTSILEQLKNSQTANLDRAAEICANSIQRGGLVFLFGAGHSRMMCEEMTPRQGGFVGFYAMVHQAITTYSDIIGANGLRTALTLEKFEGYAEEILRGFKFGPHDALIVISTSGIRPVIVEMALGAKRRGLPVIALTSIGHGSAAKAGHSSGTKLVEAADVVLDNLAPPGDCVLELQGLEWAIGPVSTITGAMLINMLRCATAERLLQAGHKPVVLPSHQFVGTTNARAAEEQLETFYEEYRKSLAHLFT